MVLHVFDVLKRCFEICVKIVFRTCFRLPFLLVFDCLGSGNNWNNYAGTHRLFLGRIHVDAR